MNVNKFYLAAPFFNAAQVQLCQEIEVAFADSGVGLFSPRQHKANSSNQKLTQSDASDIFRCNVENLDEADIVLAVVDWLLPERQQIRLLEQMNPGAFAFPQLKSDPLNIPDAGTVWEMGYAHANEIPIIMFTTRSATIPVNLMLSQCCMGIIRGVDQLLNVIRTGTPDFSKLENVSNGIRNV